MSKSNLPTYHTKPKASKSIPDKDPLAALKIKTGFWETLPVHDWLKNIKPRNKYIAGAGLIILGSTTYIAYDFHCLNKHTVHGYTTTAIDMLEKDMRLRLLFNGKIYFDCYDRRYRQNFKIKNNLAECIFTIKGNTENEESKPEKSPIARVFLQAYKRELEWEIQHIFLDVYKEGEIIGEKPSRLHFYSKDGKKKESDDNSTTDVKS